MQCNTALKTLGPWVLNSISEISYTHILNARVANVKNQPQATYTMGMKSLLMLKPSHTETSSTIRRSQTTVALRPVCDQAIANYRR